MFDLRRLAAHHAPALLRFERDNREWFARSVPDRGDAYFADFDARHAALLAEQETGACHFHLLVETDTATDAQPDGPVLGRFNLVDVADNEAELGYRVAERVTGRGVATDGVRRVAALARRAYGLRRLTAQTTLDNAGSLAVLRRTGFTPFGEVSLDGRAGLRFVRELTADD